MQRLTTFIPPHFLSQTIATHHLTDDQLYEESVHAYDFDSVWAPVLLQLRAQPGSDRISELRLFSAPGRRNWLLPRVLNIVMALGFACVGTAIRVQVRSRC